MQSQSLLFKTKLFFLTLFIVGLTFLASCSGGGGGGGSSSDSGEENQDEVVTINESPVTDDSGTSDDSDDSGSSTGGDDSGDSGSDGSDGSDGSGSTDGGDDDGDGTDGGGESTIYYLDADGDGYGTSDTTSTTQDTNYVTVSGDCDDDNSSVNPAVEEVCNDGVDNDCNEDTNCELSGTLAISTIGDSVTGVKFVGRDYDSFFITSTEGDVDNDGYNDLLLASYTSDINGSNSGVAYLIYGSAFESTSYNLSECGDDFSECAVFQGENSGDQAGYSITLANVNLGSYDDLVIGAPYYDKDSSTTNNVGAVYFISGSETRYSGVNTLGSSGKKYIGQYDGDHVGYRVANLGRVNEGSNSLFSLYSTDDVLIGASGLDSDSESNVGGAYLKYGSPLFFLGLFGSSTTITLDCSSISCAQFLGDSASDSAANVFGQGDYNGDGYKDILVGAPGFDISGTAETISNVGAVYLILGSGTSYSGSYSLGEIASSYFHGEAEDHSAGYFFSGLGDVNGDGIDDFIIASIGYEDETYGRSAYYLFYGKEDFSTGAINLSEADVKFVGAQLAWPLTVLSKIGDINGDGLNDIVIPTPSESVDDNSNGAVYVIYGRTSDSDEAFSQTFDLANADLKFTSEESDVYVGQFATGVGDINGDGIDDFTFSSVDSSGEDSIASVYLVYGQGQ